MAAVLTSAHTDTKEVEQVGVGGEAGQGVELGRQAGGVLRILGNCGGKEGGREGRGGRDGGGREEREGW